MIKQGHQYTKIELHNVVKRLKTGSLAARDEMIGAHMGLVTSLADRFSRQKPLYRDEIFSTAY